MVRRLLRRASMRLVGGLALLALIALAGARFNASGADTPRRMGPAGAAAGAGAAVAEAPQSVLANGTRIGAAVLHDVSRPLRDIAPIPAAPWTTVREMPEPEGESRGGTSAAVPDSVAQRSFGANGVTAPLAAPAPIVNFDGVGNIDGVYPPDTNGDVGPNHYVQWVNLHFQIWNKSGVSLYGPAAGNTLWSGFGGACQSQNAGDPVVLYDSAADRWVMSQFTSSNPYGECVAISTSGDPTGSYYRYFFQFSTSVFYDYPHLGVWPDGYYMSANRFGGIFQSYQGPSAIVFDRSRMLQGLSASFQEKQLSTTYGTLLPSDLDGPTPPPAGAPNHFASRFNSTTLAFWQYHVDWATPANTTLSGPTNLTVAAYNQLCSGTRSCVPQPGTSVGLDGLGDRLMHRLAYRNFGDHESLVLNHTVSLSGQAAVRWYEVRTPSAPTLYQQGTYAPDATNRWLGSVAMDSAGNMALGYTVSSGSVYPGIRYTGRLASDPLGQMPQGETTLIAGSGSQTGTGSRWGDYSMMAVDPSDDCTFWFTNEYMPTTGGAPWKTRIGAFKFGACSSGPAPTATDTPVPPTATNTSVPATATNTPLPPTATNTAVPPTATNTPNPNAPDFTVSVTPASRTVSRNASATFTVNLTSLNNFAGNVTLSVTGLPSRTSSSFSPNPVALTAGGTGASTLTVTANRNAPRGTYTLTVTGAGGGASHSQTVTLTIQ